MPDSPSSDSGRMSATASRGVASSLYASGNARRRPAWLAGALLPDRGHQRLDEVIVPGLDGLGQTALQRRLVDFGDRCAVRHVHGHVQAGEHRFAEQRRVVHRLPAVRLQQAVLDAVAHLGVVAVARQVDER